MSKEEDYFDKLFKEFADFSNYTTFPNVNSNLLREHKTEKSSWKPVRNNGHKAEINLAGVDKKDITVKVEDRMVFINTKNQPHSYTIIPKDVNKEKISAEYKNGMLTIDLPKKEKESRQIEIK